MVVSNHTDKDNHNNTNNDNADNQFHFQRPDTAIVQVIKFSHDGIIRTSRINVITVTS